MKKLAQALLDEYPNQEVVIFFNPYFVDGLIEIGTFTDADTLANSIFEINNHPLKWAVCLAPSQ